METKIIKASLLGLIVINLGFGNLNDYAMDDGSKSLDDLEIYTVYQGSYNRDGVSFYYPSTGHSKAGFVRHIIGDTNKILMYSFYIITDPHVGGYDDPPDEDYNLPGWSAVFDTLDWENRDLNIGDWTGSPPHGGTIGKYLNWGVDAINANYDYGEGNGSFCIVLGDLSNRAERAELQHAKMMLDSLVCSWVPIMGNHDTWLNYSKHIDKMTKNTTIIYKFKEET